MRAEERFFIIQFALKNSLYIFPELHTVTLKVKSKKQRKIKDGSVTCKILEAKFYLRNNFAS